MVEYSCQICNKNYATYQTMWMHNKKFHKNPAATPPPTPAATPSPPPAATPQPPPAATLPPIPAATPLIESNDKTYNCSYCDKTFRLRQYRWKHEKTCKGNNKEILELKNKISELEKKITLNDKKEPNVINNINNGNIINNNIVINNYGSESISCLSLDDIKKIAKKNINSLLYITKLLNFNENFPENHSFCTTSLEGNYVTVYNKDKNILEKKNKNDFYDLVLLNSINKLNDLIFHLEFTDDIEKKNLGKKYIAKLENILNNSEYIYSKRHKKVYKTNINQISYNKKNTVLNTWRKKLSEKAITENNNLAEEYSLSDDYELESDSDLSDSESSDSEVDLSSLIKLNAN